MNNLTFKTAVALFSLSAFTTQIVAAPLSTKPQISMPQTKPLPFDTIPAKGGVIKITPLIHASIQIEYRGKVILVDPISAGSYRKKADLILITHSHPDHFDLKGMASVYKTGTRVIAPISMDSQMRRTRFYNYSAGFSGDGVLESRSGFRYIIQAVPAYNIVRGPKPGAKFHAKADKWNGYVLILGGKRIYIAGDTEATPEMKALKNIDAAFIPMNLPYTMTPQEAAIGVRAFAPKIVYPYHFRFPFDKPNTNPQQFIQAMRGSKTQIRVLDWYNAAPVARFMKAMKKS